MSVVVRLLKRALRSVWLPVQTYIKKSCIMNSLFHTAKLHININAHKNWVHGPNGSTGAPLAGPVGKQYVMNIWPA